MHALTIPSNAPIGVFDSGVGGLSVWRYIVEMLPNESTLYFADQAHVPYGPRDQQQIRSFSRAITQFLLDQGAKLIVVACNTASGAALYWLREQFPDVSFVGMEPAVKPAVEHTKTGNVGVIATPTTFQGTLYNNLVERYGKNARIISSTCPGLATQIETGDLTGSETKAIIETCVSPLLEQNIDYLVLGCTHYPFAVQLIQSTVGNAVTLIDPAPAVVRQIERILKQQSLLALEPANEEQHIAFTSGNTVAFDEIARRLTGYDLRSHFASWQESRLISH